MTATILLLGEQNPYSYDPDDALLPWPEGASGHRLMRLLGMSQDQYLARFERRNLLRKDQPWSVQGALTSAQKILAEVRPRLVVGLGRRVSIPVCRTLDIQPALGAFEAHTKGRLTNPLGFECCLLVIPHPSARNRAWNETGARQRAAHALVEAIAWAES